MPRPLGPDDTPRRTESTDTALALMAIDRSIDAHTEEIASLGGQVGALEALVLDGRDEVRQTRRDVGAILEMLQRLAPKIDRIDEIDEVRGRVERIKIDLDRHIDDHPQAAQ